MTPCPRCDQAELEPSWQLWTAELLVTGAPQEWLRCPSCGYLCTTDSHPGADQRHWDRDLERQVAECLAEDRRKALGKRRSEKGPSREDRLRTTRLRPSQDDAVTWGQSFAIAPLTQVVSVRWEGPVPTADQARERLFRFLGWPGVDG